MMERRVRSTGRLRVAGVLLAALTVLALGAVTASAVRAQSAADLRFLADQVRALQQQVQEMQAQLYGGGAASAGGPAVATHEVRLQQLETKISVLTGKIEEASHKVQQLATQLDRMNADIDFRLQALERGGSTGAVAGTAPATGTQGLTAQTPTPPTELAPDESAMAAVAPTTAPAASGQQPGSLGTLPADQTGQLLPTIPSGAADTPEAQYQAAFGLLRQAKYADAEDAFKVFLQQFPDGPLAGNAQYWLGETYYVRGDFQNAAVAFAQGYQRYPTSSKAPDNLLKLSMSLSELGRPKDACAALSQLQSKFPTLPAKVAERAQQQRQRNSCA